MIKYPDKNSSYEDPPKTSNNWINASEAERKSLINNTLKNNLIFQGFEVINAKKNGFVTLKTEKLITADKRGMLLLDIEEILKKTVDEGITVWLEAVGDKSKLRKLRGIEIIT